jgi:hypothetical protein
MRWHKRIQVDRAGVDLAAEINAAIAVNSGRPGAATRVDSTSSVTVRQGSGPEPGSRPRRQPDDDKERT